MPRKVLASNVNADCEPRLVAFVVGVLLICRYLVPTESAATGDTLWLVQLWLAAGLLWVWDCHQRGCTTLRWNEYDLGVCLLVCGHVTSALVVVVTNGQKRAALNMLWEWIGLGVLFLIVRHTIQTRRAKQTLLLAVVFVTVCLSAIGLWQHYVWYPRTSVEYAELRNRLDQIETELESEDLENASAVVRRARDLQSEMFLKGIPFEGRTRLLWEQRLQASSEPFAFFALTNTLAGILAVALTLMLGTGFPASGSWYRWGLGGATILLTGYCLVLTKSRSAWLGLAVVMGLGIYTSIAKSTRATVFVVLAAMLLVIGGLFTLAGFSGGFDRAVLSEAPKSLRYRFEWWKATWNVIRERPVLGTGPGNFRAHYLRHKLPESSEEIADPHNLFLDVWANGGCIALLGLSIVVIAVTRDVFQTPCSDISVWQDGKSVAAIHPTLLMGASSGFLVVFAANLLFAGVYDLRLLLLFGGFVGLGFAVAGLGGRGSIWGDRDLFNHAAAVALLAHLFFAGGIAMPAVSQTLFVLLALTNWRETRQGLWVSVCEKMSGTTRPRTLAVSGVVFVALSIACLFTASRPTLLCEAFLRLGDADLIDERPLRAVGRYERAAHADPLSPEPPERLAGLYFHSWKLASRTSDDVFERVVRFASLAIQRAPDSAEGYRKLGNWCLEAYRRTNQSEYGKKAVVNLTQAVTRYPQQAELRFELASALAETRQFIPAVKHAKIALGLDRINHQAGHVDKYLSAEIMRRLYEIVSKVTQNSIPK